MLRDMLHLIPDAELMLAQDGSIYHLRMHPEQLTETIILVGDPGRVDLVAEHLTEVEPIANNREFRSIRAKKGDLPLNVVSTGIGAGCIDIVINELDALANINLKRRTTNLHTKSLRLVRIGTAGALQPDIETGTTLITAISLAFDNLALFYNRLPAIEDQDCKIRLSEHLHTEHLPQLPLPYCVPSARELTQKMASLGELGLTFSMPGFYAPQGRTLRLEPYVSHFTSTIQTFTYKGLRALNMEMESGSLNGLAAMLGHQAITLCTAINNRSHGNANTTYQQAMHNLVENVLSAL
ncbi:MAG: nucleoside phosphorylase [Bacteroides sp.]